MPNVDQWPTESAAAALLGTSVKTIARYARQGKIERRKRPVAGRKPENVCNPRDLERLLPAAHVMVPEEPPPQTEALARRPPQNGMAGEFLAFIRTIATAVSADGQTVQTKTARVWLSLDEAAEHSGLSRGFLLRLVREGAIDANRGGPHGALRLRRVSLEDFKG